MSAFASFGRQAIKEGNIDAAIGAFTEALAKEPGNARHMAELGVAWAHKKNYGEALKWLRASIEKKPDQIDVLCVNGELSIDEMDFLGAAKVLGRCLELDPQAKHPSGLRARALVKKGLKKLKAQS